MACLAVTGNWYIILERYVLNDCSLGGFLPFSQPLQRHFWIVAPLCGTVSWGRRAHKMKSRIEKGFPSSSWCPGLFLAIHNNSIHIINQRDKICFGRRSPFYYYRPWAGWKCWGRPVAVLTGENVFSLCKEERRHIPSSYSIPTWDPHKPPGEVWRGERNILGVRKTCIGNAPNDILRSMHGLSGS